MRENEILKRWQKLKEELEQQQKVLIKESIIDDEEEKQSKELVEKGVAKSLRPYSGGSNRYSEPIEVEPYKGFASALLLGFLTFLFQIFLFSIMYIIIK